MQRHWGRPSVFLKRSAEASRISLPDQPRQPRKGLVEGRSHNRLRDAMNTGNAELRLGVLVIAAMLGLSSCSTEQESKVSSTETVRDVSVLAVKQANIPDVLEAVGTVRAEQTSDLASQMMGNISKSGFTREIGFIEVK